MTDSLLQMGLSNACFSLALAIVTIPVVTIPEQPETAAAINNRSRSGPPVANNREFDVDEQPGASPSARIGPVGFSHGKEWLPPIWLLGSVVVFAWSLVRVCRFGRSSFAHGLVGWREGANCHSSYLARPNGCKAVEMDDGVEMDDAVRLSLYNSSEPLIRQRHHTAAFLH